MFVRANTDKDLLNCVIIFKLFYFGSSTVFMEKKQATLLTFFKSGAPKVSSESPSAQEPRSRPTTASSSPRSAVPEIHAKTDNSARKRPLSKNERKSSAQSSSGSSSSESSDSESCSDSSESDASMHSTPGNKRRGPVAKKSKREIDNNESLDTTIDVESLFSFGHAQEEKESRRDFQVSVTEDISSEPILSTEEIDKMCSNVPPYVAQFIRFYYELSSRFEFPSWYNPKNLRDKEKRSPSNPEYDVTTLYVPRKYGKVTEDGHSTPMLQQYWEIKEDHFSDVILFKVGKFYELFYIDAAIAQQVCQLKWMGHDRRAHVGFPETSLQHHAAMLIEQGFTVCVVEQTETVSEANERSANAGRKSTGALVERKICEVFTKGTLIHEDMLGGRACHYLCSVFVHNTDASRFGVAIVDCATGKFQIGELMSLSSLKTVIYSFQPKEILFDPRNVSAESDLSKVLNGSKESLGCVLTRWAMEKTSLPARVGELSAVVETSPPLSFAVSGVISYLKHLLLNEQVVQCGDWSALDMYGTGGGGERMMMDSTVLSQLEILKDSEQSERGSLLKFIDRTCTPFGSRLMRKWVCSPLASATAIGQRQDAVEWLVANPSVRKKLDEKLKQHLPDLERRLQRICAMALQQERNAVYFGEVENKRIGVFLSFLSSIEMGIGILEWFSNEVSEGLLSELAASREGIAEELKLACENLRSVIETKKDGSFCPRKGAFEDYDRLTEQLRDLEKELKDELGNVRENLRIKNSGEAIYVSIKYRNEVEVPVEYEGRVKNWTEADAEITSCRKGYVRFQTERIRHLVQKVEELEQQQKDLLYPFMSRLFGSINERKFLFGALIQRIGEIDCLLSLGKLAAQGGKTWTRPLIGSNNAGVVMVDSRHPIQEHLMQLEKEFVPNTLRLSESAVIVTGANMGGKSTILRQACINIILAQIGSYVPAASMTMAAPVDRIFTRIGASDNILEGKSTFLTELEETAVMLREATPRSLLVIDELGRGTSTYDGVAIAGATLAAITKIGCMCMFATHYHKLCEEDNGKVELFHMECVTKEGGSIELTHKFKKGLYPHSQAMHVARLAGIPESILAEADDISQRFLRNTLIVNDPK